MLLERSILSRLSLFSAIAGVNKDYLSIIKNQGSYGVCWAYSTISAIEMQYGVISGNRMKFSPWKTIVDDILDYFKGKPQYQTCQNFAENYFYNHFCAFEYLVKSKKHMIMQYNNQSSTIYVKNYNYLLFSSLSMEKLIELLSQGHPLVTVMNATALLRLRDVSIVDDYYIGPDTMNGVDHAIVATAVGTIEGRDGIYLEILNSWGEDIGSEGLNYIKIADSVNGTLKRSFNSLFYVLTFETGDEPVSSSNGWMIASIVMALLLILIFVILGVLIARKMKSKSQLNDPLN